MQSTPIAWPATLAAAVVTICASSFATLSLVAAHAELPPLHHMRMTMPNPMLRLAAVVDRVPALRPGAMEPKVRIETPRPMVMRVRADGAIMRGAAGAAALEVWRLRPAVEVELISQRGSWSQVNQNGLVGWVPTSALESD